MFLDLPWKIITTFYVCRGFDHPVDHPPCWTTQPHSVLVLDQAGTGVLRTQEDPLEYNVDAEERNLFYLHPELRRYILVSGSRPMRLIVLAFNIELENGPEFSRYYTIPLVFPGETRLALNKAILTLHALHDDTSIPACFERQRQMQIVSGRLLEHAAIRSDVPPEAVSVRCAPAANELNLHYTEPLDIDRLAKLCSVSRSHFFRLFRMEYGMTPQEYQLRKRLKEAQRLLLFSKLPISEVAWRAGWNDPFHFSRFFSREVGCSPSHYRESHL